MSEDILAMIDSSEELEFEEDFDSALEAVAAELVEVEDESGDASEARAREVTEAIRSAATATFVLLAWAHEHNAHKALGYATWAEYVQTEFDMSAQRSYQLLDLSKITHEIEAVVPEGTEVKLTEAQARDIKRELPLVTEKITERVASGEDAEAAVESVIDEIREQKKAEEKALTAQEKAEAAERAEAYQKDLESAADQLLEKDAEERPDPNLIEVEPSGEMSTEDSMNLYNFSNALAGIASLPEPDDFIKAIPASRVEEVERQLLEVVSWVNRFHTLWEVEHGS